MAEQAQAGVDDGLELKTIADRIRRQPQLARELNVSALAQEVAGRWRQHSDMLQASEEVPVAAWIVRKKVEGLIRPDDPEPDGPSFDPALRPAWLDEAVEELGERAQGARRFWGRAASVPERPPAPVKDPSPWKLAWSYPVLRVKKEPPPRIVAREAEPLGDHMQRLLEAMSSGLPYNFRAGLQGRPRPEWVAQFLAAVHLWHARSIEAEQAAPFEEIRMVKRGDTP